MPSRTAVSTPGRKAEVCSNIASLRVTVGFPTLPTTFSVKGRTLDALRIRNRYRRASTFGNGQVVPLTVTVLPKCPGRTPAGRSLGPPRRR